METQIHKAKFKFSLSNGETIYENKGSFQEITGERSALQRINSYIAEKGLTVTSLSIYTDSGQNYMLPSLGKNPQFKEFREAPKPKYFVANRRMAREMDIVNGNAENVEISEWFAVIEAVYDSYKLQLWVDEQNPRNCWVLVTI